MNKYQKSILMTAANIMIIGFSAIAATTATVAWFQFSDNLTAEGVSIECKSADKTVEWNILRYSDDTKRGELFHDSKEFYLPSYDQYISDKNFNSNVILAATVLTPNGLRPDEQVYVDISCTQPLYDPINTSSLSAFTSNVCRFKVTVYAYETTIGEIITCNSSVSRVDPRETNVSKANTAYVTATEFFHSTNSGATSFTSIHNGTPTKDRDNLITVIPRFNSSGDIATKLYIYLECSYDPDLVEYYISQLNHDSLYSEKIDITGDIDEIKFRFGQKYEGSYIQVASQSDLTSDSDYMITYDDYPVAFDGSGTLAAHYRSTDYRNYIPVEINRNRIAATETTHASDWSYTAAQNIRSRAGWNIGATSAYGASNGLIPSQATNYPNDLTYQSGGVVSASNNDKYLSFDANRNKTRFDYWDDTSVDGVEGVKFYKYSNSAEANSILDSLRIDTTGVQTNFAVGDVFNHSGMKVYAKYTGDDNEYRVETKCAWTGYNMNVAGRQEVMVSYTEDGITATAPYSINVVSGPTVKLTPNYYEGHVNERLRVKATANLFAVSRPTFTFTINDSKIAAIMPVQPNYDDGEPENIYYLDVTFTKAGPAKITCTVTDDYGNEDSATLTLRVLGAADSATTYQKVTTQAQLTPGDYIIVYDQDPAETRMFNGALDPLDAANNYLPVTVNNLNISDSEEVKPGRFTISTVPGSAIDSKEYYITNQSDIRIGASTNANTLSSGAAGTTAGDKLINVITIDEDTGNAHIVASSGAVLRYNAANNQERFRYYKSGTYTSQQPITLYKLQEGGDVNKTCKRIFISAPFPSEFKTRDIFSTAGGVVYAEFNNGSYQDVTSECKFTGYDMYHAGTQTVQIDYSYRGKPATPVQYQIRVTDPDLTGIRLEFTNTAKTDFEQGDTIGSQGIRVYAQYSNGSEAEVTDAPRCRFTGYPSDPDFLGTTTITCSYTEGALTFTKEFDITVSPATVGFKIVKDASELQVGDHIIITARDYDLTLSKEKKDNNRSTTKIVKNGEHVPMTEDMAIFEVFEGMNGGWAFYDKSYKGYLCTASSSSNYLRSQANITAESSWSVSCSSDGTATVVGLGKYTRKNFRYNKSSNLFACYASGQYDISIYRWHGEWTQQDIPLVSISVDDPIYEITRGVPFNLAAELIFSPMDATDTRVTYTSGNTSIATVSNTGEVVGMLGSTEGNDVTITVTSVEDTSIKCVVNIRVKNPYTPVTGVIIDEGDMSINLGDSASLHAHVMPLDASDQGIFWESDDPSIVSITEDGVITALSGGANNSNITIGITAYSNEDPNFNATIQVTVLAGSIVHVTGISIDTVASDELTVGDEINLTATVYPADATYPDYAFEVVTTDGYDNCLTITPEGHLKAIAEGIGCVRVHTTRDGDFSDTLEFIVEAGEVTEPVWTLATSISDLSVGSQVIIVAATTNLGAMLWSSGNNLKTSSVTKDTATNTLTDIGTAGVFTLGQNGGDWTFCQFGSSAGAGNGSYLAATGGSKNNYLKTEASAATATTHFSISIASSGVATVTCTASGTTKNLMRYNNSSTLFSCYGSGQQDICLYVNKGAAWSPASSGPSKKSIVLKPTPLNELVEQNKLIVPIETSLKEKYSTNFLAFHKEVLKIFNIKAKQNTLIKNLLERRCGYATR